MSESNKITPELIVLKQLKHLPAGVVSYLQTSPIEYGKVLGWAILHGAEKVYYWPRMKSAFIVQELVQKPASPPTKFLPLYDL